MKMLSKNKSYVSKITRHHIFNSEQNLLYLNLPITSEYDKDNFDFKKKI